MDLLVIRHAIATDRVEGATDAEDAARPLTERGRRRFRRCVRGMVRLGLQVDRVVHSPWTRAVQTADLLGPIVDGELDELRTATPHLAGPPRADLLGVIASTGAGRVAVVGHEPWLGELVAMLTAGAPTLGEAIPFKKGGVACLEGTLAPGGMRLRALLPPSVLRKIR
jgi:phosphohistidine phosphatase